MAGSSSAQPSRAPFVRPVLPPSPRRVRSALALVSDAVTERSAAIHTAYTGAPARIFIDEMMATTSACEAVAHLAGFLDLDVPPAQDGVSCVGASER